MAPISEQFRYVAIEGPIGVGKTSLARKLAETFGGETLLEAPQENPFLERFYQDRRGNALATQLHFLFQRSRQSQLIRQSDLFAPVRIADFMFDKDRLFAQLTLDDEELKLYELVFERLAMDAPQPDLVIYLQASVDTLLERIGQRGIGYEQSIDADYLARLAELYTRFFHAYDRGPLLIVNTDSANLVSSDGDYKTLLEQLSFAQSGRRYFNAFQSEID
ncbi:MAG: deoxynucleoside kinase [Gammaproteobacteria bacterium]|nr:deoxynucleoside kinase [Gammaproteobacteria bacterium]